MVTIGRRMFCGCACAAVLLPPGIVRAQQQPAPASAGPADPALVKDLVDANHILFDQGVVDGFGHVSARHDKDPNRYLLARSMAPALVTEADIMEFDLDSVAVDPRGRSGYLERFIHGEIYRQRPDVKSVVHSHSPAVIPFADSRVALRPLYHMSSFLGTGTPVFEIRDAGGPATDMLIRDRELGHALAVSLGDRAGDPDAGTRLHRSWPLDPASRVPRGLYRGERAAGERCAAARSC